MYTADGSITNEEIENYAPPVQQGAGKSPPISGNQLPAGAMGVNDQPIPDTARTADNMFVEYQGKWWSVAKPKPVFKKVHDHLVLIDPQSHNIIKDYGPESGAKVTTRQTLQPGDDGQMHLVNLTSITTPEGAKIDVEPEQIEGASPTAKPAAAPKPKSVASALKPAGKVTPVKPAIPATAPAAKVAGSVVPGLTTLAASKNPLFKSDLAQYTKAAEDAEGKQKMLKQAEGLLKDEKRVTDLELVFSWVRSNVQGAGRMTNTEIIQAGKAGSWSVRVKNAIEQASTGRLAPELEQQFLADIRRSYEVAQEQANTLRPKPGNTGSDDLAERLKKALEKK
jgi:hypothetical protein